LNALSEMPFIVGIGGTVAESSSTEKALSLALSAAESAGAKVQLFGGTTLARLPHYLVAGCREAPVAEELLEAIRAADGIIIASPGYHGSISGLVKNAIDYIEETSRDKRAYLDGVPVGLVATAYGWQATGSTLAALRSIVHALRGWPTPLGVAINSSLGIFEGAQCTEPAVAKQLALVGRQVHDFAMLKRKGISSVVGEVLT
jgi:FMN reductase